MGFEVGAASRRQSARIVIAATLPAGTTNTAEGPALGTKVPSVCPTRDVRFMLAGHRARRRECLA